MGTSSASTTTVQAPAAAGQRARPSPTIDSRRTSVRLSGPPAGRMVRSRPTTTTARSISTAAATNDTPRSARNDEKMTLVSVSNRSSCTAPNSDRE